MEEGERWRRFADSFQNADHCYRVRHVPKLSEIDALPSFQNESVKCYSCEEKAFRVYCETNGKAYATVLESSDSCWDIAVREDLHPWGSEVEHLFVMYGLPRCLLRRDRLLLHCAYILTEYGAVVFTAPSGTGKTTQAELWRKHRGSRIINGDRAILGFDQGKATVHSFVHSGSSDCCENVSAPLAAIVCLSQAKENRVTQLRGMQALRRLLQGTYLLPEFREDMPKLVELSQRFCQEVPLLHLACLPDGTAVDALEAAFVELNIGIQP